MTQAQITTEKIEILNANIEIVQAKINNTIDALTKRQNSKFFVKKKDDLEDELRCLELELKEEYEALDLLQL